MESFFVSSLEEYNQLKQKKLLHPRLTSVSFLCKNCGKNTSKHVRNLKDDLVFFCNKCKKEKTCLEKFGTKNPFLSKDIQNKAHQTISMHCKRKKIEKDIEKQKQKEEKQKQKETAIIERFGSLENYLKYNALSSPNEKTRFMEVIKHGSHENAQKIRVQKIQKTKKERYGDPCYSNSELRKKTNLKKYGTEYYFQSKDAIDKIKNTKLQRYGSSGYNNREKAEKTNIKKYGFITPSKNDSVKKKSIETSFKHHGVRNGGGSMQAMQKMHSRYLYQEQSFDSADELALFIYLTDNNISFEYKPKVYFEYIFNSKKHRYYPDFKIGEDLIEIKGSHFFDKDGKMRCPFRAKTWTDEDKAKIDNLYEAKHQCMLNNNVKILKSEDTKKYVEFVKQRYNKDYLQTFRKRKSKE